MVVVAIGMIRFYQQEGMTTGFAPSFIVSTVSGEKINFPNPESKATLVHFWATWCGICALENDHIQNIAKTGDYQLINIAWQSGSDEELTKYASKHQLALNTMVNDQTGALAKIYGVNATPSSFIVDSSGKIIFTEVGYTTEFGLRLRLWWASL